MHNLTLYTYFRSSTAYRARIALNLKGLKYQQIPVHLLEDGGQQYKPEYLAINPTSEVPTLIHDRKIIAQSFAIIEYLDEVFLSPKLMPTDAYERAKVRQICENINCGIHPLTNLKVMQFLNREMGTQQNDKWQQHWIKKGLGSLEVILQKTAGNFAFGNSITCADIFIIPQLFSAERFGVSIKEYPILNQINTICLEIDAFKLAHPYCQPDTPKELLKK
jgi:maleylacetoacetate isomerase/maleylpyruvate isomerase